MVVGYMYQIKEYIVKNYDEKRKTFFTIYMLLKRILNSHI